MSHGNLQEVQGATTGCSSVRSRCRTHVHDAQPRDRRIAIRPTRLLGSVSTRASKKSNRSSPMTELERNKRLYQQRRIAEKAAEEEYVVRERCHACCILHCSLELDVCEPIQANESDPFLQVLGYHQTSTTGAMTVKRFIRPCCCRSLWDSIDDTMVIISVIHAADWCGGIQQLLSGWFTVFSTHLQQNASQWVVVLSAIAGT